MRTVSLAVLPGSFIFAQEKRAPLISAETCRKSWIVNCGFSGVRLAGGPRRVHTSVNAARMSACATTSLALALLFTAAAAAQPVSPTFSRPMNMLRAAPA
jgi:hypothetical protein